MGAKRGFPEVAATYRQDDVQQFINGVATPYVVVTVRKPEVNGKTFVAIQVSGFEEMPVVCKAGSSSLRQGAVYVRSRTMHQTVEVQTEADMRELLDRAIEVGVQKRLRPMIDALRETFGVAEPATATRYAEERGDL